jgi:hypothetical protein
VNDTVKETARPRFFVQPVQNQAESAKENRPIFESKRFVELKHPGDRSWSFIEEIDEAGMGLTRRNTVEGPKGEDYAERFPREWASFKKGEERAAIGTPIEEWSGLSRSRAAELKAMNIFTVEEFADVQDGQLGKLGMGTRTEREKARAYLAQASGGADVSAMAAQIAQLTEMVERLSKPTIDHDEERSGQYAVTEKPLEECSDAELKAYIKEKTGKGVPGQPSRESLLAKAAELAEAA